jgi:hypothetical protein
VTVLFGDARLPLRFWTKVDVDEAGCWLWGASVDLGGYARFHIGRPSAGTARMASAHRVAYSSLVGPIPEGLQLDHLCRVRHCVNPKHLEPVTHRENVLRGAGVAAGYARRTHCRHGHVLVGRNVISRPDGGRRCRACKNAAGLRRYHALKELSG